MPKNKDLASTSVPGAAIVVGGLLLLACLVAPLYAAQRVVWLVRLLTGMFGLLCVVLGVLAKWQEGLLVRLHDDDEDRRPYSPTGLMASK